MAILRELLAKAVEEPESYPVFYLKRAAERRFVFCEPSEATHRLQIGGENEPNVSCVFAEDAFGNEDEWRRLALSVDPRVEELIYREDYEPSSPDWVLLLPWNVPLVSSFWRRMPNDSWVAWIDYPALLEPIPTDSEGGQA